MSTTPLSPSESAGSPGTSLLVVQPDAIGPLQCFDAWLASEGVTTRVVRPYLGEPVPTEIDEEGLIVLGGDMSSLDDATYSWLADVRALMRAAHDAARPSMGICLGGQLMAQAFGGITAVGEAGLEAGVTRVTWRPDAAGDEIFGDLGVDSLAASMHGDAIVALPGDAVWLGESTLYRHQAFRVGSTSWGVQFHPEVDLARYAAWVDAATDSPPDDRARLQAGQQAFARVEDQVLTGMRAVCARFAAEVRRRAIAARTG